jgi:hypothetical protein
LSAPYQPVNGVQSRDQRTITRRHGATGCETRDEAAELRPRLRRGQHGADAWFVSRMIPGENPMGSISPASLRSVAIDECIRGRVRRLWPEGTVCENIRCAWYRPVQSSSLDGLPGSLGRDRLPGHSLRSQLLTNAPFPAPERPRIRRGLRRLASACARGVSLHKAQTSNGR